MGFFIRLWSGLPGASGLLLALLVLAAPLPALSQQGSGSDSATTALSSGSEPHDILQQLLEPILNDQAMKGCDSALHVVDVASGDEVFAWNASTALLPASTMKVITSGAALRNLGPAFRFSTEVLYDGKLGDDGVLHGNLYVRGGGDPTLVIEKLWKLVLDTKLEGVREVKGNVYFDDSHFDNDSGIPGWNKKVDVENGPSYFPPLGALSLNFNTVAIVVGPGSGVGVPARVELETESAVLHVRNDAVTVSSGAGRWIKLEREVVGSEVTYRISGAIPLSSESRRYYRTVADSTAYFTGAFAALCKELGIRVRGHFLSGGIPETARSLVTLSSPPLAAILMDMNKFSNNFMSEQILKALGAQVVGEPGTTEKGIQVVRKYLADLGIPEDQYQLVNGSGLSREARVRTEHLTAVLLDMYHDLRVGAEFRSSLSIGGTDGTLRSRFRGDDEPGRLRGKTGSLNGVHCLAGYVEAADHRVYAFAFMVNDIVGPLSRIKKIQDRFARTMFQLTFPLVLVE